MAFGFFLVGASRPSRRSISQRTARLLVSVFEPHPKVKVYEFKGTFAPEGNRVNGVSPGNRGICAAPTGLWVFILPVSQR